MVGVPLSSEHSHNHIQHNLKQHQSHINLSKSFVLRWIRKEEPSKAANLVRSDIRRTEEAVTGENLNSSDPSKVPPVGTVAGGDKGRVIVRGVLRWGEFGTIGEGDIVCSEDLIGDIRGRDEENGTGPELEIKHGAMDGGEFG